MTKLVRKLKQMAKKRSHRKAVQKRKADRIQREIEREKETDQQRLERETDKELARLNGEAVDSDYEDEDTGDRGQAETQGKRQVRVVGDLVLDAPVKKKKQLTRKQAKRQDKMKARGEAITEMISKKWDHKKRRVKVRAQIRNEDLH